jgi:pyruvate dehydrogenase E2 component (dihydrolipoamide acetyltransferase)
MAVEILMPALSPTMEEGTLAKWLVKEGDVVKSGQIIAEIETDKATMEFEAVDEGIVGKILVAEGHGGGEGEHADCGAGRGRRGCLIGRGAALIGGGGGGEERRAASDERLRPVAAPAPAPASAGARVFASPLARRIAKEKGLDLGP